MVSVGSKDGSWIEATTNEAKNVKKLVVPEKLNKDERQGIGSEPQLFITNKNLCSKRMAQREAMASNGMEAPITYSNKSLNNYTTADSRYNCLANERTINNARTKWNIDVRTNISGDGSSTQPKLSEPNEFIADKFGKPVVTPHHYNNSRRRRRSNSEPDECVPPFSSQNSNTVKAQNSSVSEAPPSQISHVSSNLNIIDSPYNSGFPNRSYPSMNTSNSSVSEVSTFSSSFPMNKINSLPASRRRNLPSGSFKCKLTNAPLLLPFSISPLSPTGDSESNVRAGQEQSLWEKEVNNNSTNAVADHVCVPEKAQDTLSHSDAVPHPSSFQPLSVQKHISLPHPFYSPSMSQKSFTPTLQPLPVLKLSSNDKLSKTLSKAQERLFWERANHLPGVGFRRSSSVCSEPCLTERRKHRFDAVLRRATKNNYFRMRLGRHLRPKRIIPSKEILSSPKINMVEPIYGKEYNQHSSFSPPFHEYERIHQFTSNLNTHFIISSGTPSTTDNIPKVLSGLQTTPIQCISTDAVSSDQYQNSISYYNASEGRNISPNAISDVLPLSAPVSVPVSSRDVSNDDVLSKHKQGLSSIDPDFQTPTLLPNASPQEKILWQLWNQLSNCTLKDTKPDSDFLSQEYIPSVAVDRSCSASVYLLLSDFVLRGVLKRITPTEKEREVKRVIFNALASFLKNWKGDGIRVYVAGSTAYDVDSTSSDLDVVVTTYESNHLNVLKNLSTMITEAQKQCGKDSRFDWPLKSVEMQLVHNARVPILLLKSPQGIVCDISVNTDNSISHTEFFKSILRKKIHLRALMRLIKFWVKARRLPAMRDGGLPSIVWMLLCVFACRQTEICSSYIETLGNPFCKSGTDIEKDINKMTSSSNHDNHIIQFSTHINPNVLSNSETYPIHNTDNISIPKFNYQNTFIHQDITKVTSSFTEWMWSLKLSQTDTNLIAPYTILLAEFFSRLSSRHVLTSTVSVAAGLCIPKNLSDVSQRILSPPYHGGVWDELLSVEDPANFDREYFPNALLVPAEKLLFKSLCAPNVSANGVPTPVFRDLASKISSATWLVYQYELRRAASIMKSIISGFTHFHDLMNKESSTSPMSLLICYLNEFSNLFGSLFEETHEARYKVPASLTQLSGSSSFHISSSSPTRSPFHSSIDKVHSQNHTDGNDNISSSIAPDHILLNTTDDLGKERVYQFALVLLNGKLMLLKLTKICVDQAGWWSNEFLSRRDIRSVLHGVPYYSVVVPKHPDVSYSNRDIQYSHHPDHLHTESILTPQTCDATINPPFDFNNPMKPDKTLLSPQDNDSSYTSDVAFQRSQFFDIDPPLTTPDDHSLTQNIDGQRWLLCSSDIFNHFIKCVADGLRVLESTVPTTHLTYFGRQIRLNLPNTAELLETHSNSLNHEKNTEILFNPCNLVCLFYGRELSNNKNVYELSEEEMTCLIEYIRIAEEGPYWFKNLPVNRLLNGSDSTFATPIQPAVTSCKHCHSQGIMTRYNYEIGLPHHPLHWRFFLQWGPIFGTGRSQTDGVCTTREPDQTLRCVIRTLLLAAISEHVDKHDDTSLKIEQNIERTVFPIVKENTVIKELARNEFNLIFQQLNMNTDQTNGITQLQDTQCDNNTSNVLLSSEIVSMNQPKWTPKIKDEHLLVNPLSTTYNTHSCKLPLNSSFTQSEEYSMSEIDATPAMPFSSLALTTTSSSNTPYTSMKKNLIPYSFPTLNSTIPDTLFDLNNIPCLETTEDLSNSIELSPESLFLLQKKQKTLQSPFVMCWEDTYLHLNNHMNTQSNMFVSDTNKKNNNYYHYLKDTSSDHLFKTSSINRQYYSHNLNRLYSPTFTPHILQDMSSYCLSEKVHTTISESNTLSNRSSYVSPIQRIVQPSSTYIANGQPLLLQLNPIFTFGSVIGIPFVSVQSSNAYHTIYSLSNKIPLLSTEFQLKDYSNESPPAIIQNPVLYGTAIVPKSFSASSSSSSFLSSCNPIHPCQQDSNDHNNSYPISCIEHSQNVSSTHSYPSLFPNPEFCSSSFQIIPSLSTRESQTPYHSKTYDVEGISTLSKPTELSCRVTILQESHAISDTSHPQLHKFESETPQLCQQSISKDRPMSKQHVQSEPFVCDQIKFENTHLPTHRMSCSPTPPASIITSSITDCQSSIHLSHHTEWDSTTNINDIDSTTMLLPNSSSQLMSQDHLSLGCYSDNLIVLKDKNHSIQQIIDHPIHTTLCEIHTPTIHLDQTIENCPNKHLNNSVKKKKNKSCLTMNHITDFNSHETTSYSKNDSTRILNGIGTSETSSIPYQSCRQNGQLNDVYPQINNKNFICTNRSKITSSDHTSINTIDIQCNASPGCSQSFDTLSTPNTIEKQLVNPISLEDHLSSDSYPAIHPNVLFEHNTPMHSCNSSTCRTGSSGFRLFSCIDDESNPDPTMNTSWNQLNPLHTSRELSSLSRKSSSLLSVDTRDDQQCEPIHSNDFIVQKSISSEHECLIDQHSSRLCLPHHDTPIESCCNVSNSKLLDTIIYELQLSTNEDKSNSVLNIYSYLDKKKVQTDVEPIQDHGSFQSINQTNVNPSCFEIDSVVQHPQLTKPLNPIQPLLPQIQHLSIHTERVPNKRRSDLPRYIPPSQRSLDNLTISGGDSLPHSTVHIEIQPEICIQKTSSSLSIVEPLCNKSSYDISNQDDICHDMIPNIVTHSQHISSDTIDQNDGIGYSTNDCHYSDSVKDKKQDNKQQKRLEKLNAHATFPLHQHRHHDHDPDGGNGGAPLGGNSTNSTGSYQMNYSYHQDTKGNNKKSSFSSSSSSRYHLMDIDSVQNNKEGFTLTRFRDDVGLCYDDYINGQLMLHTLLILLRTFEAWRNRIFSNAIHSIVY